MRDNRQAGNNYERKIVLELKELNFDVVTSRAESKTMDNKKVDIFSPLGVDNVLTFYIQCKNSKNKPDYHKIITEMPKDRTPVIFHKQTHKVNTTFVTDGEYVIMKKEAFYKLIKEIL